VIGVGAHPVADDFSQNWSSALVRVLEFLDIPAYNRVPISKTNAQPGAPMLESLRRRLSKQFEAQDEALIEFLGSTPSWRR